MFDRLCRVCLGGGLCASLLCTYEHSHAAACSPCWCLCGQACEAHLSFSLQSGRCSWWDRSPTRWPRDTRAPSCTARSAPAGIPPVSLLSSIRLRVNLRFSDCVPSSCLQFAGTVAASVGNAWRGCCSFSRKRCGWTVRAQSPSQLSSFGRKLSGFLCIFVFGQCWYAVRALGFWALVLVIKVLFDTYILWPSVAGEPLIALFSRGACSGGACSRNLCCSDYVD